MVEFRTSFGVNANLMFAVGIGLLSPVGLIGSNWEEMTFILASIPLLILFTIPFMDESWRWFHSKVSRFPEKPF